MKTEHRTSAYYTAKLTFSYNFPIKVGMRTSIAQVSVLYLNFYSIYIAISVTKQHDRDAL